jgi:hypothetical protein
MLMDRPAEIDPGPCQLCGCTIDRHEGPELFCDDLEREIYLSACALVREWEMDDPRDRWRHTGEPRPDPIVSLRRPEPYHPWQSTVDAFRLLTAAGDLGRLREWLADRPKDAPYLLSLLEGQDNA